MSRDLLFLESGEEEWKKSNDHEWKTKKVQVELVYNYRLTSHILVGYFVSARHQED